MPATRLLFLLVFALISRGDELRAQPLPERRPLSGRVSSLKGVPVFGAEIQIKRKEANANAVFWGASVLSDVMGEFNVPDAEEGDYLITVFAPGYETWSEPYTLREYEPPIRVLLRRKVSLIFTLLSPDGEPVRGKSAAVFGYVTKAGQWQRNNQPGIPLGTTSLTTPRGECTLLNRSEGIYHELYVAVRGVGYARWTEKVELLEGGTHHFDLHLQKATAALRVTVHEESPDSTAKGRPLGAAQIHPQVVQPLQASDKALADWLFRQNDLVSRDGAGTVELTNLLPGHYEIRISTPLNCSLARFAEFVRSVDIESDEEKEVAFRFPACSDNTPALQITLHDEQGRPLKQRNVRFFCVPLDETTGANLPFAEARERRLPFPSIRRGTTDEQGNLTIYPFWTGLWRISASESEARLPYQGTATVKVAPEGSQMIIYTTLKPEFEN